MAKKIRKQKISYGKIFRNLIIFFVFVLIILVLGFKVTSFRKLSNWQMAQVDIPESNLENVSMETLLSDQRCSFNQAMLLINEEYPIEQGVEPEISQYNDSGVYMNDVIIDSYAVMSSEILEKFDEKIYVMSAYRSNEEQRKLYYEDENPDAIAPGSSEHEVGLALDVYVKYYAGAGFLKHEVGQYMQKHCQDYGFIIRYPRGKEHITGISYEPWHLRYVGQPHAKIIMENKLTLEEYHKSYLQEDVFYKCENYIITKQNTDNLFTIPKEFKSISISPDNMGGYVLTIEVNNLTVN